MYSYRNGGELYHHGVLGMKWGVRRFQNKDGSLTALGIIREKELNKYGENVSKIITTKAGVLTINHSPPYLLERLNIIKGNPKEPSYTIYNNNGKNMGTIDLHRKSKNELNIGWIGINKSLQGQGYGNAIIKSIIDHAKTNGYKQISTEPMSSQGLAVVERNGFKPTGRSVGTKEIPLPVYILQLDNTIKHSFDLNADFIHDLERNLNMMSNELNLLSQEEFSMDNNAIQHHGILGMKWGGASSS